ncbi:hypothetical protein JTE90_010769 [Oedothorax gibbosus]|uniref:TAFH domain-containing protein n=1 Tax=Oedothorax gibbosus TaxID=931172 RepID=A0AAV6TX16_9ARAC|nr:hypothetical protein JTE90_010769 [Oedothorax gibbosus]
MASTKSLEDMLLSSDIDESAVSALVGSLESQLSSSDAHYPRNEVSATSINNNHIPNASVADCTARLPDGQKHGALLGSLLEQGAQNTNKNLVNPQQIMGLNAVSSQNLSNAVIVSLPGALPASGYLNQVSSTQQAFLSPSVVSRHVSSADIKLVYSPHSTSSVHFSSSPVVSTVSTVIATTTNSGGRFKAPLHNGNSTFGGQPTLSAMQNLANIASQQPRIQVASSTPSPMPPQHALKSVQLRSPAVDKQNNDSRHSPSLSNHYQVQQGTASVITSKAPGQMNSPVNVVVSNPNMQNVQIINVNNRLGQKTLAPRGLVLGNQLRIAPQFIRQGTPIVPGQGTIALPPGMRSAIVVRADGSQYHVYNVAPPNMQGGNANSLRLQSMAGGVPGIIRTISHPQVVSVPVSSGSVKTIQTVPGGIVRTISPQQMTVTTQALVKSQPHTVVSTVLQQTTSSVTRSSPSSTTASSGAMSPNTIKKKCQNFLSTLIRLAGTEATKTASNVKKLIQSLIDGTIEPEEFSTQLQKELQSNHQPYLIHFLKKSLPHVRQALLSGEMTIEGIRPPPLPASMQSIAPTTQIGTLRPILAPTTRGGIVTTIGSALTAQLSQPTVSTILTQRLITPQGAQNITRPVRPLTVATTGGSLVYSGMVQSSPATVGALQSKTILNKTVSIIKTTSTAKEKKPFVSVRDEDDINDVAAMGGVNLVEESQRILATNSELIGSQIRSCKDDNHFLSSALHRKILQIAKKHGLEEVKSDVVDLVSHAAENRLKSLIERLSTVAEHRCENPKLDPRFEVTSDTKAQIKFLEELDKLEKKRHDDQEKEILLKAAKSRSKLEDPELLKLKQKAKEMQRAEIEEVRQREANMTALLAIGLRKKFKPDPASTPTSQSGNSESPTSSTGPKTAVRPRVKRVNLRDLLFVIENDFKTVRRPLLYKYYAR